MGNQKTNQQKKKRNQKNNMIITVTDLELSPTNILVEEYIPDVDGYMPEDDMDNKPFFGRVVNSWGGQYPVGSILFFRRDVFSTVSINGKMYYLLEERDVVAKIKKPE